MTSSASSGTVPALLGDRVLAARRSAGVRVQLAPVRATICRGELRHRCTESSGSNWVLSDQRGRRADALRWRTATLGRGDRGPAPRYGEHVDDEAAAAIVSA